MSLFLNLNLFPQLNSVSETIEDVALLRAGVRVRTLKQHEVVRHWLVIETFCNFAKTPQIIILIFFQLHTSI